MSMIVMPSNGRVIGGSPRCYRASISLPGRNELKIFERRLGKERLVRTLRQRPQDRRRLVPGVPILAAADPDGAGKGSAEAGEKLLGRGLRRRHRGAAGARLADQPHDAGDLLFET